MRKKDPVAGGFPDVGMALKDMQDLESVRARAYMEYHEEKTVIWQWQWR